MRLIAYGREDLPSNAWLRFKRLGLALLSMAVIMILSQVLMQRHLARQVDELQTLNLAGRQLMLTERIARLALSLKADQNNEEREKIADDLSDALHVWQVTQQGLQEGSDSLRLPGGNSPAVTQLFKDISKPFLEIQKGSTAIIEQMAFHQQVSMAYLQPHIARVMAHEPAFLLGMNRIVQQYQAETGQRATALSRWLYVLLLFTLLVVSAILIYELRPSVTHAVRNAGDRRTHKKSARSQVK